MRRLRLAALIGGLPAILLLLPATAQQISLEPEVRVASRPYAPHTPQLSARTNLVEVGVVVRDRAGNPVANLGQSNFQLFDDGAARPVTAFWVETAPGATVAATRAGPPPAAAPATPSPAGPPRYVTLFFDDYSMDAVNLAMARNAARKFLKQGLGDNALLGIFTSSGAVGMDFTANRADWDKALDQLHYRARMPREGIIPGTSFSSYFAYQTLLAPSKLNPFAKIARARMQEASLCGDLDSCQTVLLAEARSTVALAEDISTDTLEALQRAIAYLSTKPGPRTLLLVSSGFLTATVQEHQEAVVNQALRAGVVIDTLDAKLLETEPPEASALEHMVTFAEHQGLNDVLAGLADATGGRFLHDNNDMAGAMRRMASEPEARYVLSFSPAKMPFDGAFHKLKVTVAGVPHPDVEARKGYYDPDQDEDLFAAAPQAALDAAVLGPATAAAVPTRVATAWRQGKLQVEVNVDTAHFHFAKKDERSRARLTFTSAIFDSSGAFVVGKTGAMGLELTNATRARMAKTGVSAVLSLPLAPGHYRLREVVEEGNRGQVTVLDRPIAVQQ